MPAQTSFATAAGIMFLAGLGIPVFAALNGGLGWQLESPVAAAAIDRFGAIHFALTPRHAPGIAVTAPGVWLAKRTA